MLQKATALKFSGCFEGLYGSKNPHILSGWKGWACMARQRQSPVTDWFFDSSRNSFFSFIKDLSI
ncbi:hypothetical protein [Polaromonas sp. A23]|uniref:hypothetical protein n=1 Tax=Polaromonas sp. A23 TaxID=1944133 RepID=UPI001C2B9166|nr:hypothetical protein [Polaromonas sp. A23]